MTENIRLWFGLEGISKITYNSSDMSRDTTALAKAAKCPKQPDPEHFQGWNVHNFSGQLLPVTHHPQSRISS